MFQMMRLPFFVFFFLNCNDIDDKYDFIHRKRACCWFLQSEDKQGKREVEHAAAAGSGSAGEVCVVVRSSVRQAAAAITRCAQLRVQVRGLHLLNCTERVEREGGGNERTEGETRGGVQLKGVGVFLGFFLMGRNGIMGQNSRRVLSTIKRANASWKYLGETQYD